MIIVVSLVTIALVSMVSIFVFVFVVVVVVVDVNDVGVVIVVVVVVVVVVVFVFIFVFVVVDAMMTVVVDPMVLPGMEKKERGLVGVEHAPGTPQPRPRPVASAVQKSGHFVARNKSTTPTLVHSGIFFFYYFYYFIIIYVFIRQIMAAFQKVCQKFSCVSWFGQV